MGKEGVRYLTWSVPLLHALMTLVDFVDMLDLEQVCLREERVQVLHVGVRGRGVLGRSPRQRLDGDGRGAEAVLLHLETYLREVYELQRRKLFYQQVRCFIKAFANCSEFSCLRNLPNSLRNLQNSL